MALPSDITLVPVRGSFIDMNGNPATGTITLTPSTSVYHPATSTQILPVQFKASVGNDGKFLVSVIAVDDPDFTPTEWAYKVEVRIGSYSRTFNMQPRMADSTDGIDILTVAPSDPAEAMATYVLSVNDQLPDANGNVTITAAVGEVQWSSILSRPSAFPPATHTHTRADITDLPATFPPSVHTHTSSQITDLSAALSDTPMYLRRSGSAWPTRPATTRLVFWIGGTEADAPPGAQAGDRWLPGG